LKTAPVLRLPDFARLFILYTDASDKGIGVNLSQDFEDGEHPVCYYSRVLQPAERKWSVSEKECLAVVVGIKIYRPYLYGKKFKVVTDHISLKYLQAIKDLDGRLGRWSLKLQPFDFEIVHRAGKKHQNVDALSRAPAPDDINYATYTATQPAIPYSTTTKAATSKRKLNTSSATTAPPQPVTSLSVNSIHASTLHNNKSEYTMNADSIALEQQRDTHIKALREYIQYGYVPEDSQLARRIVAESKEYIVQQTTSGQPILYHVTTQKKDAHKQVVIPKSLRAIVLSQAHDDLLSAHKGIQKTYEYVRDRYYWVNMLNDCEIYVKSCVTCQQFDNPSVAMKPKYPVLSLPIAAAPWERVAVDIVGPLHASSRGNKYIIVFTDYLTRWVEAFPIATQDALTIAKILITEIICRYGSPKILLSNRGAAFLSELSKQVYELMKIHKVNTSSYHPQCNGLVERFNGTLVRMLKKYVSTQQLEWDIYIPMCLWSYRTSYQSTIHEMPYYTLFGTKPRQPVDVILNSDEKKYSDRYEYVNEVRDRLEHAHVIVKQQLQASVDKREAKQNEKEIKYTEFKPDDLVLMYVPRVKRGMSKKLAPLWKGPYTILQPINKVTYKIRLIGSNKARPMLAHVSRLKAYVQAQELSTDYDSEPESVANYSEDGYVSQQDNILSEATDAAVEVNNSEDEGVLSDGQVVASENGEGMYEGKYVDKEDGEMSEGVYEYANVNAIYINNYTTDEEKPLTSLSTHAKPIHTHRHKTKKHNRLVMPYQY
jgi:hypothetical protein